MAKWKIDWFVCTANAEDVRHAKECGHKTPKTIGEELWRKPNSIGPIIPHLDYWAGYHLSLSEERAKLVAQTPLLIEVKRLLKERDFASALALLDDVPDKMPD